MRRLPWLLAAVVVLVVVVAGVIVVVVRARDGDASASSCDLPDTTPDTRSALVTSAPGGGGVEVVENGLSSGPGGLSMAVVLRNTSATQVAYRTRISFTPAGRDWFIEVPVLLPGEKIGVAAQFKTSLSPAQPEILLGQTHWADAKQQLFRPVTTTVEGSARTRITSPYCRDVARHGVAVLFRDAAGTLLGGTMIPDGPDAVCRTGDGPPIPDVPAGADAGRTEAYAYCDPAAVDRNPTGRAGVNYRYS